MYSNSHLHHQSGHFMAQGSHIQQPLGAEHYSHGGYGHDGNGNYNGPVIVGVSSPYHLPGQQHNAPVQKLPLIGKGSLTPDDPEDLLDPSFQLKESPPSSIEALESDSSLEPKPKKRKTGGSASGSFPKAKNNIVRSKSGKGGRHQDEIRTVFKFENGQWLCPKCNKAVSPRATRMKQHFEKCCSVMPSISTFVDIKLGHLSSLASQKKSVPPSTEQNLDDFSDDSDDNDDQLEKPTTKKQKGKGEVPVAVGIGVGRQKSDVWQYYEEREEGCFYCKKCGKKVSSKAHRLHQHLTRACIDSPRYVASEMRKMGFSSAPSSSPKDDVRQHFDCKDGQWCCSKCGKQVPSSMDKMKKHLELWCGVTGSLGGAIASLVPTSNPPAVGSTLPGSSKLPVTKSEAILINHQLGKFIFSSNLPFDVVQDPEFIQFVKMLRVNHKLPTAQDLGDSILTDVENEIQLDMKKCLQDKSVTLIQYGWSNINASESGSINDFNGTTSSSSKSPHNSNSSSYAVHTIIHALHNGKQSFFLNASQIYSDDVTPSDCLKLINSAMETACTQFNCEVVGILTDHCKSTLAFRESVQKSHPSLHVYGCYLYLLDSLGKDLTDLDVISSVMKVQKYFSGRTDENEIEALGGSGSGSAIFVPDDSTWSSQPESLTSFLANHGKYVDFSKNPQLHTDENITAILDNRELFSTVQELILVLVPLSQALVKLQNDTATIADAVNCWLTLMNDPQISACHKDRIRDTFTEGVTPMAIAAYLLHPVYRGQNMDSELQEVGRMWLLERNPMFVVGQAALERADTQYFPSSFLNSIVAKQMAPAVWWENAGKWPAIPDGLMSLAISLMVLPASTSTVDQCSNTIAHILSAQKKVLGSEKALKLSNAFFSLKRK